MTAPLPNETVEAAARAEWAVQCEQSQAFTAALGFPAADVVPWEDVPEPIREKTRERVRASVQAAFPLIRSQVLTETADMWTQGAWGNTPRRADRVADRLAAAQFVGDWLRALATTEGVRPFYISETTTPPPPDPAAEKAHRRDPEGDR